MSYPEQELVYYVQFARREDSSDAFTEEYYSDVERETSIQDARADGYIAVRLWEVIADAL